MGIFHHPFFIRLKHWEYWNRTIVYAPLYPLWVWFSLRARSFFFLSAANPNIRNGGFIMESKKEIYDQLPTSFYPTTLYFRANTPNNIVLQQLGQSNITYPLIAKPDHGERGRAVKKIHTQLELLDYIERMPLSYLLQEFIPYPNEVGIFYYRMPGGAKGHISGIVNKFPVTVVGNGKETVKQLAWQNERYLLQWKHIKQLDFNLLNSIPAIGEAIVLVPYGNHSRGCLFTDESAKITVSLTETINTICSSIPEFYYGRLDIRFNTWQELEQGQNFSIIEVNGSGSEPTHIYDPAHSIFFAWKEIARHWNILHKIAKANNKRGVPYMTIMQGRADLLEFWAIDATLAKQTW